MSASTSSQGNPGPQPAPAENTQTNPGTSQAQTQGGQAGGTNPQNPGQQPDSEVQKLLQTMQQAAMTLGASEGGLTRADRRTEPGRIRAGATPAAIVPDGSRLCPPGLGTGDR